jgi:hypothetical protein
MRPSCPSPATRRWTVPAAPTASLVACSKHRRPSCTGQMEREVAAFWRRSATASGSDARLQLDRPSAYAFGHPALEGDQDGSRDHPCPYHPDQRGADGYRLGRIHGEPSTGTTPRNGQTSTLESSRPINCRSMLFEGVRRSKRARNSAIDGCGVT